MKVLIALLVIGCAAASEPIDQQTVLSLDPDELAMKLGDGSEAGQDRAARMWAAAKRLETENRLAKKDVGKVLRLDGWRRALERWQSLQLETFAREAGGGTMWGHLASRDDVTLERFLAEHAEGLTADDADEVEAAGLDLLGPSMKRLDAAEKMIKEFGMPGFDRKDLEQRLTRSQQELSWMTGALADADARRAVTEWITSLAADE